MLLGLLLPWGLLLHTPKHPQPNRKTFMTAYPNNPEDNYYDELDALDTSDSWEAQMQEEQMWKRKRRETTQSNYDSGVDEEAHFDIGDDSDDSWTAAELLDSVKVAAAAASDNNVHRTVESLKSIITILTRLEEKVDALSNKVQDLAHRPCSDSTSEEPCAQLESVWDGTTDETAYFDDDAADGDLEDWRVRRARNQLRDQGLDGTWPPDLD